LPACDRGNSVLNGRVLIGKPKKTGTGEKTWWEEVSSMRGVERKLC